MASAVFHSMSPDSGNGHFFAARMKVAFFPIAKPFLSSGNELGLELERQRSIPYMHLFLSTKVLG